MGTGRELMAEKARLMEVYANQLDNYEALIDSCTELLRANKNNKGAKVNLKKAMKSKQALLDKIVKDAKKNVRRK